MTEERNRSVDDRERAEHLRQMLRRRRRQLSIAMYATGVASVAVSIAVAAVAGSGRLFDIGSHPDEDLTRLISTGAMAGTMTVLLAMMYRLVRFSRPRHKVFVSFSEMDRQFVDELVASLQTRGVNIIDTASTIRVGDNIRDRIRELVAESSHAILVVSPSFNESSWTAIELAMLRRSIKVLPIVIGNAKIPQGLELVQHATSDGTVTPKLVDSLLASLPRE